MLVFRNPPILSAPKAWNIHGTSTTPEFSIRQKHKEWSLKREYTIFRRCFSQPKITSFLIKSLKWVRVVLPNSTKRSKKGMCSPFSSQVKGPSSKLHLVFDGPLFFQMLYEVEVPWICSAFAQCFFSTCQSARPSGYTSKMYHYIFDVPKNDSQWWKIQNVILTFWRWGVSKYVSCIEGRSPLFNPVGIRVQRGGVEGPEFPSGRLTFFIHTDAVRFWVYLSCWSHVLSRELAIRKCIDPYYIPLYF